MSNSNSSCTISPSFDLKEYVEVSTDAARRTRIVTIILIVATVSLAIGYYNSLGNSWANQRIKSAFDTSEGRLKAIREKLGIEPDEVGQLSEIDKKKLDTFILSLQTGAIDDYRRNVRLIPIPFFNLTVDVNDLGVMGGIGLIIILILMRYSLSREIKNLNVSFKEACEHNRLCEFYHSLAMRQVLTIPKMKGEEQNEFLAILPSYSCKLPAIIFTFGVIYDLYSFGIFGYSSKQVFLQLLIETVSLIIIWILSLKCSERLRYINSIWENFWGLVEQKPSSIIRLDQDLVTAFGDDKKANSALRYLLKESSQNLPVKPDTPINEGLIT
jgi:hypothetical protein